MKDSRSQFNIWYAAGLVIALAAGAEWYISYHWNHPLYPSWQLMTAVSAMWVISAVLICIPTLLELKARRLDNEARAVTSLENADKVIEQAAKTVDSIDSAGTRMLELKTSIETQVDAALCQLKDAQSNDMLLMLRENVQQAVSERLEWQDRCERWQEGMIDIYDTIQRVMALSDLENETYRASKRMLRTLDTVCTSRGLDRIAPEVGVSFDDRLHRVVSEVVDESLPPESVIGIERWGYRNGDEVIRPAEVIATPASVTTSN